MLRQPTIRDGRWQLLECRPAWDGNWTWNCFLTFAWESPGKERLLVAVNYAGNQSQCYLRLPFADLGNARYLLKDLLGESAFLRDGSDLQSRGLYLDMAPWQAHILNMESST